MADPVCTICLQHSDDPFHTLPCGHQFHVGCVVQWFREGYSSCCNCRSQVLAARLKRRTPGQRIAALRRKKHLSNATRKLLAEHDKLRVAWLSASSTLRAFRTQHRDTLREYARLRSRHLESSRRWRSSLRRLSVIAGDASFYEVRDSDDTLSSIEEL